MRRNMAERGSGSASANFVRSQLRDSGANAVLVVKVLDKAVDLLQDVENMSPQTMARKGHKRVAEAHQSVQAGLSGVDQDTDQLTRKSGMQYPAHKRVCEMMESGSGEEGACNLISLLGSVRCKPSAWQYIVEQQV